MIDPLYEMGGTHCTEYPKLGDRNFRTFLPRPGDRLFLPGAYEETYLGCNDADSDDTRQIVSKLSMLPELSRPSELSD